ncbi:MAG: C45 family autoproteolytic acyltransferase/hydrolase [bacterium]
MIKTSMRTLLLFFITACAALNIARAQEEKAPELRVEGGRTYFGEAWREERNGFVTVHLKGTPYEIGCQRGALLKDEIRYALEAIDDELREMISEYGGMEANDSTVMMLKDMAYTSFISRLEKLIPGEYVQEMKGIAKGAGVKYREILYLNAGYDVIENLAQMYCSAFAAAPPATKDGLTFHGRNLDWDPPDLIAAQNIIFFIEPEKGYPLVNIAPAPFVCVVTAMNLEGLSVTVNVSFSNVPRVEGVPTFIMLRRVVQHAATLDEAVGMIEGSPRTVGNNFMIADGKSGDAALLECTSERCEARKPENGLLHATNHFVHPDMKPMQYPFTFYGRSNTGGRFERLGALLAEQAAAPLDLETLIGIFRDRYNWETGDVDSFCHQSICNPKTAQSVIFSPTDRRFWIAAPLPTPACDGRYTGFDLKAEFGKAPAPVLQSFAENPHRETQDYKAFELFREGERILREGKPAEAAERFERAAAMAPGSATLLRRIGEIYCNESEDYAAAARHLENAAALARNKATDRYPFATNYYFLGKAYLGAGEFGKAVENLDEVFKHDPDHDREAWTHVRLGQAYDMLGEREKAVSHYDAARKTQIKEAALAAGKYIQSPFAPGAMKLEKGTKESYARNAI